MAGNIVNILIRADNKTRPGLREADRDVKAFGASVAKVGAALAAASAGVALAGPIGAATLAMGAFAAVALPAISAVEKKGAVLNAQQKQLKTAVDSVKDTFKQLQMASMPLIISVTKLAGQFLTALMPALHKLIPAGAQIIRDFITPLISLTKSPVFAQFIDQVVRFGVEAGKVVGAGAADLLKILMQLFIQVMPSGLIILKALIPMLADVLKILTPIVVLLAKIVAPTVMWLQKAHLLGPVLLVVAAGIAAVKLGLITLKAEMLTNPITLLLVAIVALAAVIIKYHKQIWDFLVRMWHTIWNFLKIIWNDIFQWGKRIWGDLVQWIWNDFVMKLVRFFTQTLPAAFRLFKDTVGMIWNIVKLHFLELVHSILEAASHLPFVGRKFGEMADDVQRSINRAEREVHKSAVRIQGDLDALHGKKVGLTFGLDLPPGVSYPSRHIKGRGAKGVSGAAAGTWLVGEEGPELAYLPQGTHVLPAGPTSRIMGGLARGTMGITSQFVPRVGPFLGRFNQRFYNLGNYLIDYIQRNATQSGGFGGGGGGVLGGDPAVNMRLARAMFPWPASMWPAFYALEMSEAGFNRFALNPSSGAYGIPQALPPTKMPFAAQAAGGSHAGPQLGWMYNYIGGRYGNPVNAWAWHQAHNWYGSGGPASGWVGVGEHGRELVRLPVGSHVYSNADSQRMMTGGGRGVIELRVTGGQGEFERFMAKLIQRYVRVNGQGSVQTAFGG
jgi:hypothetical protein